MSKNANGKVLLVGTGPMAIEYVKVLNALGVEVLAVGRGEASAAQFTAQTGIAALTGGVEAWAQANRGHVPANAIVACGEKWVGVAARALLDAGCLRLLAEKPGGFDAPDIVQVQQSAKRNGAEVFVGYNRRFYAAVDKAREIIREGGGVTSFSFEFTEWSHVIGGLEKEEGVKEQWFLSNSTHLIDLAFFLGGRPRDWNAYTSGSLAWHPQASVFAGAGRSESGALFSYQANWEAPGRFSLDVLTRKHRLIFRPIEKLQIQDIGSVAINPVEVDYDLDERFKPGLYGQVKAFLGAEEDSPLPTLADQLEMLPFYLRMRGDSA